MKMGKAKEKEAGNSSEKKLKNVFISSDGNAYCFLVI